MKINIKAKILFDDKLGRLKNGDIVDLPEHKALFYVARQEAEFYETKVLREKPSEPAGQPASVLPVDQALINTTLKPLDNGGKQTKRTKKA